MKKYYSLILFFYLVCSVNINAQSNFPFLPENNLERLPFLDFFGPSFNVIDFNSLSNYHFFNSYAFNPAMAGIEDKRQINFDWNRQVNHSASLSYEQPIANINSAIGVQYEYSDKSYGKIHRYGLAYNYAFRWKENSQLRIGAQISQVNVKIDEFSYFLLEGDKWYSFPSLDFGLAFQYKQLRLGASVQNLVPKEYATFNIITEDFTNQVKTVRIVNISAANTFRLSKKWDWSLAFLLRFNSQEVISDYYYYYEYGSNRSRHDLSSYFSFQKKWTIGMTYRTQFDPVWIGFVGVKLKEKLNLQLSFNTKKDSYEPRFWEVLTQYQF
ncbi:MAG: type IX secretion system membrane protein PorP/SprF [Saprospiraceae bacterium]